tara:strand:+ start:55 stop:384 length:330 start_codon:yes stop_codon:yes gene_type:complete
MTNIYSTIKRIIQKPTRNIVYIPYQVPSYSKVLDIWKIYKRDKIIDLDKPILNNIFDFHYSNNNHVLLYYSKNLDHCLMMCKINNKYVNISAPIEPLINIKNNFIATYC